MNAVNHATGTVRTPEVTIYFREFGKSWHTPLLILHGLSYFSYDWIDTARKLSSNRKVVAIDMRGFGDSTESQTKDYSLEAFARDIDEVLLHFGWSNVILMGHSMGGRNAAYFASTRPEKVSRLVLVDYSPDGSPEGLRRVTESIAGLPDSFSTLEEAITYFGDDSSNANTRARYEAYLRSTGSGYVVKRDDEFRARFRRVKETGERIPLGADMWQVFAKIASPVLVIKGKRSDMFAPESADRIIRTLPHFKVVELDTGHNVAWDDPEGLASTVAAFIN